MMTIYQLEDKILEILKTGEKNTDELEKLLNETKLDDCSDKIVYALIRLKNKNKIINRFENKKNVWSLTGR